MKPREKARRARLFLYVAASFCMLLAFVAEPLNIGEFVCYLPFLIIGLALVPYFMYERCPSCRKMAYISRDRVKFCPYCGVDVDTCDLGDFRDKKR